VARDDHGAHNFGAFVQAKVAALFRRLGRGAVTGIAARGQERLDVAQVVDALAVECTFGRTLRADPAVSAGGRRPLRSLKWA
jgi:hypothetical protein